MMTIQKAYVARALNLIMVMTFLAAMGASAEAAEKGRKSDHANASRKAQAGSASRGRPTARKGTQGASGNIKIPSKIEFPNLARSPRSTERALQPTSQEYPNVVESVSVKYTMLHRNRSGVTTLGGGKDKGWNAGLLGDKNQLAIEGRNKASRLNRKQHSFTVPEVGDEVLLTGQLSNPSRSDQASKRSRQK